jgi:hypothetical protein
MKFKLCLLSLVFALNYHVHAQKISIGDIIVLTNTVPTTSQTQSLYADNTDMSKILNYLETNVKFRVLSIEDTKVNLMALPFKLKTQTQRDQFVQAFPEEKLKSDYYNNKVYTISLKDFNAFAEKVEAKDRMSIGLLTLPFKARPQDDFSFDTEFNLSTTLNIRIWDVAGSTINYQLGAGIGSVGLNTTNANGIESEDAQDVATLTVFNGIMLQYKKVQVGFYVGVDQINNQNKYDWVSNGNLWLGFGIGYNLFNISVSEASNKQ